MMISKIRGSVFLLAICSLFYACKSMDNKRTIASIEEIDFSGVQPTPEQGESWGPADEEISKKIVEETKNTILQNKRPGDVFKRDAHPKQHGCVNAKLHIDPQNLPPGLQVGLFGKQSRDFDAWVRFSNASPDHHKADAENDVRGMSVKLVNFTDKTFLVSQGLEDNHGTLDLILINKDNFFLNTSKEYLDFFKALHSGGLKFAAYMVTHPGVAKRLAIGNAKTANPLQANYNSMVPYKLGPTSMKFSFASCTPEEKWAKIPRKPSPDFLKNALISSVEDEENCFDFKVQINPNKAFDIEKPAKSWSTKISPWITVGRLTIPRQTGVGSEKQINFCENLNFNPWRTVVENRPMGAVNRIRLSVYKHISAFRHSHNQIPELEPMSTNIGEICSGKTAPLCLKQGN